LGLGKVGGNSGDNYIKNLNDNISFVIITCFLTLAFFIWMNYLLNFVKFENLRLMNKKI